MKPQTIYEPRGRAREYALLALELYRSKHHPRGGCIHGCSYCYVPGCLKLTQAEFRTGVRPRDGILAALAKEAPNFAHHGARVLLSFFSDPYQPYSVRNITREALAILAANNVSFSVLTKGGTGAIKDFDQYRDTDAFGCTLTTLCNATAAKIEPLAAAPTLRVEALMAAKEKGIHTYVSLEPVLDPDATLAIIEAIHPFVDHFNVGKLNHDPEAEARIDWRLFGFKALDRLRNFGKTYTIKDDLARYLDGIPFAKTDDRIARPAAAAVPVREYGSHGRQKRGPRHGDPPAVAQADGRA